MKRTARFVLGIFTIAAVAALLGAFVPRPLWPSQATAQPATRHILVLKNPIHTDIAVPVDDALRQRFHFLADDRLPLDNPGARYIIFGWGGRAFYIATPTWSDLKPMPLFKGLTLDASVMHVEVTGAIPEPHPDVAGLDIGEAQFQALLDFIDASFQQGPNGPIKVEGAAYNDYDGFYEANGTFTALAGCNTWTAAALRSAGLRTGWWNPLPTSLLMSLRLYN